MPTSFRNWNAQVILNGTIYQAPASYVKTLSDSYFVFIFPIEPTNPHFQYGRSIINLISKILPISLVAGETTLPEVIQLETVRAGIWTYVSVTGLLRAQHWNCAWWLAGAQ